MLILVLVVEAPGPKGCACGETDSRQWTEKQKREGAQYLLDKHELYKVKVKVTYSCPTLCHSMDCPWNSPGQNPGVGSLSLLQENFPNQGSNPGLLYCRWILYQLSHKGSPRTLEWVTYPFSRGSSRSRGQTGVSCIAGRFFTNLALREALYVV